MEKHIGIDLNKISLYVFITMTGAIFSVFSLIYNINYINYGFITFIYGYIAQIWDLAINYIIIEKEEKEKKKYWILYIGHITLIAWWIYILCQL